MVIIVYVIFVVKNKSIIKASSLSSSIIIESNFAFNFYSFCILNDKIHQNS